jgi:sortase A
MTQVVGTASATPDPYRPAGPTRTERRYQRVEKARRFTQNLGEIFISAGVVVLMFCAYQLWWTNVESERATNQVVAQVRQSFTVPYTPVQKQKLEVGDGDGFGLMYIPRLGKDWVKPLVEGSSLENLKKGVTHYSETTMPGEIGNFAVAGHRATNGEPFRNLDRMRAGDKVYVETADSWYTYQITKSQIVKPTDVWVLNPVPTKDGKQKPKEELLTLTTCNPRWASYERLIVFGKNIQTIDKSTGQVPDGLKGVV